MLVSRASRVVCGVRGLCSSSKKLVTSRDIGDVKVLTMDDGKMNAFSFAMIADLHAALDEAETAGAAVLTGNQKCFSAGFDLSVMGKAPSPDAAKLLGEGAELLVRLLEFPRPLVMAAPGHAVRC